MNFRSDDFFRGSGAGGAVVRARSPRDLAGLGAALHAVPTPPPHPATWLSLCVYASGLGGVFEIAPFSPLRVGWDFSNCVCCEGGGVQVGSRSFSLCCRQGFWAPKLSDIPPFGLPLSSWEASARAARRSHSWDPRGTRRPVFPALEWAHADPLPACHSLAI